ncbi:hypothetical protein CICLE_v10024383mg, partial [Citrus x clementina]
RWHWERTINYNPKRTRFCTQHRGRMKGISYRGNHICFGRYALQTLEPAWITSRQIKAGRRAMTRNVQRGGKIWVRSPKYWVAVVKLGRLLYEMSGVAKNISQKAISIATSKMPIRTQFIISG